MPFADTYLGSSRSVAPLPLSCPRIRAHSGVFLTSRGTFHTTCGLGASRMPVFGSVFVYVGRSRRAILPQLEISLPECPSSDIQHRPSDESPRLMPRPGAQLHRRSPRPAGGISRLGRWSGSKCGELTPYRSYVSPKRRQNRPGWLGGSRTDGAPSEPQWKELEAGWDGLGRNRFGRDAMSGRRLTN